jgi:phage terminase large subunit-like protein
MQYASKESLYKDARRVLQVVRGWNTQQVPKKAVDFAEKTLGLTLTDWQRDFLASDHPRRLLLCCRQSGKSTMAAVEALHVALTEPNSLVVILAPSEKQAKETFGKVAAFYRRVGEILPAESYRKTGLQLSNGSRIETSAGTEKTTRGFSSVRLLIVDEASRIDDDLYFAIRPMLAVSGGTLVMLSTPFGRRGVFYEEWTEGKGWQKFKVTVDDLPDDWYLPSKAEYLAEERETLPNRIIRQEYYCYFVETDEQVFSEELIASITSDDYEPWNY